MRLNELYARYKDQVRFFIIYMREAHPARGWQVPNNLIDADGRVVYTGNKGPFGWDDEAFDTALRKLIA